MSIQYSENGKPREAAVYENKSASITVDDGALPATNLKTKTGFTTLFDSLPGKTAHRINIQSSGTAYIRLNSVTGDVITVTATAPFIDNETQVKDIFVSTNNVALTLTVFLK